MIREKMFVVSEILDESIKSQTPVYDVTLFNTFINFESYIEGTPIIINTLIITSRELPFNNSNMARLMQVIDSPFLQITGPVIYIIDSSYNKKTVEMFMKSAELDKYAIYQGDIDVRYVTDIITGEARESQEQQTYEVTYRIRAEEFVRQAAEIQHDDTEQRFMTDEDDLAGIPDEEEPKDILPETEYETKITYIAGEDREERTVLCFLIAQYLALNGKTVIIEHDTEYHRLTEYYTKSGIKGVTFITVNEMYSNVQDVIFRIKESKDKLIVIGAIDRIRYDYNFMFSLLYNNLKSFISDIIMECNYDEVPYGVDVIYVCQNTVPDVLKMAINISQVVVPEKTKFIGLQMHDIVPIDLTTEEMIAIISSVLSKNEIDGEVVYAGGIRLKGEKTAYDICSIISGTH